MKGINRSGRATSGATATAAAALGAVTLLLAGGASAGALDGWSAQLEGKLKLKVKHLGRDAHPVEVPIVFEDGTYALVDEDGFVHDGDVVPKGSGRKFLLVPTVASLEELRAEIAAGVEELIQDELGEDAAADVTLKKVKLQAKLSKNLEDIRLKLKVKFLADSDAFHDTRKGKLQLKAEGTLAEDAVPTYALTTHASPAAGGEVIASPERDRYPAGAVVALVADPAAGYGFSSWSGDLSGSQNPAALTMDEDKDVTATFFTVTTVKAQLMVERTGSGSGSVTGSGIDCGSDCSQNFAPGAQVVLTAHPAQSNIVTWSGCSSASGTQCSVTVVGVRTVTARFEKLVVDPKNPGPVGPLPGGPIEPLPPDPIDPLPL
jgi:hypothetical protein